MICTSPCIYKQAQDSSYESIFNQVLKQIKREQRPYCLIRLTVFGEHQHLILVPSVLTRVSFPSQSVVQNHSHLPKGWPWKVVHLVTSDRYYDHKPCSKQAEFSSVTDFEPCAWDHTISGHLCKFGCL